MSLTHSSASCSKRLSIQASLSSGVSPLHLSALLDSGSENNFIDIEVAQQAGFPIEPLESPLIVRDHSTSVNHLWESQGNYFF